MSMRTVYIRKENEEVFDSLPNKAEVVNWALAQIRKKRENQEPKYTPPEQIA